MKSKITSAIALLMTLGTCNAVHAADAPSWNYVEAHYGSVNYDGFGKSLHGFNAAGVASINERFFMSVNVSDASRNIEGVDVSVANFSLGVGAKWNGVTLSKKPTDVFVQLYRGETTAEMSSELQTDKTRPDFWELEAGFRVMATPELELGMSLKNSKMDYEDDTSERDTSVQAQVRYFVAKNCALTAKASSASSIDQFGLGVSYSF